MRPLVDHPQGSTIVYAHLASNALIEERFGWEAQGAYIDLITSYLARTCKDMQRERGHCVVTRAFADDYVMIFPTRDDDRATSTRLAEEMTRHLQAVDHDLAALHQLYLGIYQLTPFSRIHPERLLYRGIQRAQMEATDVRRQKLSKQARILDRCLENPSCFAMVYQPIVRLTDDTVFAYEALVRCTEKSLRSPPVLLNVAEESGRIQPLSRLLRRTALAPAASLPPNTLLFINLHPEDFNDPLLLGPEPFVQEHASRVVFEVTERAAIADFEAFRRKLAVLREAGLRIAVDDLGSGYAALSSAVEIDPDFIKLDMTLVRDIDKSAIRRNLMRNMIAFAIEADVAVVAEGVETAGELEVLRDLGCQYAQGYYLARPMSTFARTITLGSAELAQARQSATGIP